MLLTTEQFTRIAGELAPHDDESGMSVYLTRSHGDKIVVAITDVNGSNVDTFTVGTDGEIDEPRP